MDQFSSQSFPVIVSSALLVVLIGGTFLYLFLKNLRDDIQLYWSAMNDKMRLRIDKIPNLIETVQRYQKDYQQLLEEMIRLRTSCWPLEVPSIKKVQSELQLSADLHDIWNFAKNNPALKNDVNFMALKKEIQDLGQEIDEMTDVYNEKIRHFNRRIRFLLFRPFASLFRFQKMAIFEFEA